MRGSLRRPPPLPLRRGSIPAHAGEPYDRNWTGITSRVYPRACGGARGLSRGLNLNNGLSPRMRGSPDVRGLLNLPPGSIPAHAGEPPPVPPGRFGSRVYPRACGGAKPLTILTGIEAGLSPRMRGSLETSVGFFALLGSIPAHAGEPAPRPCSTSPSRVYPRACGGAQTLTMDGSTLTGLSPRMRGSRPQSLADLPRHGSIPAHAGEPINHIWMKDNAGVYPRACGGAVEAFKDRCWDQGLSPRMRGSLPQCYRAPVPGGSIPAHAGEPRARSGSGPRAGVYPRTCGGASGRQAIGIA